MDEMGIMVRVWVTWEQDRARTAEGQEKVG